MTAASKRRRPRGESTADYDLLVKDVVVVRPQGNAVHRADIAIKDGKFVRIAPGIDPAGAKQVLEGKGRLARIVGFATNLR